MACDICQGREIVWKPGRGYIRCYCTRPDPTGQKAVTRNALASIKDKPASYGFGVAVRAASKHFDVQEMAKIADCKPETIRKALTNQMTLGEEENAAS